jgi:hypothetical protein
LISVRPYYLNQPASFPLIEHPTRPIQFWRQTSPKDRHPRKEKGEINEEKTFMVLEYSIQSQSHEYSYATDHTTPSSVAGFFRGQQKFHFKIIKYMIPISNNT